MECFDARWHLQHLESVFKLDSVRLIALPYNNLVILDPTFVPSNATFELFLFSPGFVVTPNRANHKQVLEQVNDFVRKLQWTSILSSTLPELRFGLLKSSRFPPAGLVPRYVSELSRRVIREACAIIRRPHECFASCNLSLELKNEILRLKNNSNIEIKPSDKGKRWVIMSSILYDQEALRQLQNTEFYQSNPEDLVPRVRGFLMRILSHLHERDFISKKELAFLAPPNDFKDRTFFLLPKLHKKIWPVNGMPPGRPVVSDCGSLTRNVSNFIDYFFKPICELQDSYLQDSGHLIALTRTFSVSNSDILFTMDVESLYTNVPTDESVGIISGLLRRHPDASRPDLSLMSLLKLLLTTNDFKFKDTRWLQRSGVAMGKSFGGSYANLFMAHWETTAMDQCRLLPTFWKRYQDDIVGVWPHGEQELLTFFEVLNTFHPNIKLSLSYGEEVNFLDLTLRIRNQRIEYRTFSKDTDCHILLTPSSHHPSRTFRGIIFGEILRIATHSSSKSSFQATYSKVKEAWISQGYSRTLVRDVKRSVLGLTYQLTSWETGFFQCSVSCSVCPYTGPVSTYRHPKKNITYPIFYSLSCDTSEVVYIIKCLRCDKLYVGETERPLRTRILEHLGNIRRAAQTPLAQHFSNVCSVNEFFFFAIKKVPKTEKRRAEEARWISQLSTQHPDGLNSASRNGTRRTNLVLPFADCANRVVTSVMNSCGRRLVRASFYRSRNLRECFS